MDWDEIIQITLQFSIWLYPYSNIFGPLSESWFMYIIIALYISFFYELNLITYYKLL